MSTEKDLLELVIKNDEAAFKQVFDLYVKRVYQFVFRIVRDNAEAADISQDIFIKIWEKRSSIDTDKSFDGFIFTIAYRSVIDFLRKNKNKFQNTINSDSHLENIIAAGNAEDLVNLHQLESIYEKALQTLPPKRKEIFCLSRHAGLSNKEIADKLNISIKTVEAQMTLALATLKEYFNDSELSILILFFTFIEFN